MVSEWSCLWTPVGQTRRSMSRGTEWYILRNGQIGEKVIVPIDGVSSAETYSEQYTAWHLANAPGGIGPNVTLAKIEMIKF